MLEHMAIRIPWTRAQFGKQNQAIYRNKRNHFRVVVVDLEESVALNLSFY